MSETTLTVECSVHFRHGRTGRKELTRGTAPAAVPVGRVPRAARLLALAIKFEGLIRDGVIANYAELARLGHVTTARVTQVMNLLLLAPDLQEEILFLPPTERGRDRIRLADLQPIALTPDWRRQRRLWADLVRFRAGTAGR